MRAQTDYNKVVNFNKETNEITVLDYTFDNGGFKGATGSIFEPISKQQYKEQTTGEAVSEYLQSCYDRDDLKKYIGTGSYKEAAKKIKKAGEVRELIFDDSYSELWGYLRTELKLNFDEAYIFNCIGGGRCFDKDFEGNINTELIEVIRQFES